MESGKKYVMFVDETGTPKGNTQFNLTGVLMEYKYSIDADETGLPCVLKRRLQAFKRDVFKTEQIPLHLKEILKAEHPYGKEDGITIDMLRDFWDKLPDFLRGIDCTIVSVEVDKQKLHDFYSTPKDPYVVAFAHLMKSFYAFLEETEAVSARVVLESRDDYQNLLIQKAFFDIFNSGTVHLDVEKSRQKIKGFIFSEKQNTMYQSGLEIADLVCLPLSRVRRGVIEVKPRFVHYGDENRIFKAIKDKIYIRKESPDQDFRNWGFKKVPITKKRREWSDHPWNH
ncbi:MAG: DUF3800 domain-containing protein [Exiguobacterium marinum]|uniref:DUF3800 domain-containing protein n=2 Tax=Exiguobacterium TaxID=33986 RepID=A0ABY7X1X7_9BACL|nr:MULTISPECIES: DUF3800 domain-containing protein [Exiguobacterium]WDH77108.1 DUF3800 domain-containing protein [Exiguobacterium marinum]